MPSTSSSKTSRVAQFISRRIDELRPRRSQLEIATAAGFRSANMLSMIRGGQSKMPLDRVIPLAKALECDTAELARLALEQFYEQPVMDMIFSAAPKRSVTSELETLATWAVVLNVEVRAALREVKFAKQFATSLMSRAGRVEDRLERIKVELDEMVITARTPGALR